MSKIQNAIDRNPCSWPAILAKKHSRFGHINMLTRPRGISIRQLIITSAFLTLAQKKSSHHQQKEDEK
jgi:hypothetical protein